MAKFRVALSGDFRKPTARRPIRCFDLAPLADDAGVEVAYVDPVDRVMRAADLEGFDALILLGPRFDARSIPADGRLAVVARFGVGYDTVDVAACTEAGIALVITPDGVRRPVAVSILTLMLALTQKLLTKDRLTREGPAGLGQALRPHGRRASSAGRWAQLGIGNIGAEVFRLAAPVRHALHRPRSLCRPARSRPSSASSWSGSRTLFRAADFLSVSVPLSDATHHIVDAAPARR